MTERPAPNRINWHKLPPVASGYKRGWCQCNVCGHVAYRDYIPYSLSNPVLVLPCGHGMTQRFAEGARSIMEEEARRLTASPTADWIEARTAFLVEEGVTHEEAAKRASADFSVLAYFFGPTMAAKSSVRGVPQKEDDHEPS